MWIHHPSLPGEMVNLGAATSMRPKSKRGDVVTELAVSFPGTDEPLVLRGPSVDAWYRWHCERAWKGGTEENAAEESEGSEFRNMETGG